MVLVLLLPIISGRFPHSDIYDSKRSLAPHRSLSQPNTSFILFFTQGIRSILLIRFVAICKIILFYSSNKRNILYHCVKYLQLHEEYIFLKIYHFSVADRFIRKWKLIARLFSTFFHFFLSRSYAAILAKNGILKNIFWLFFDFFNKKLKIFLIFLHSIFFLCSAYTFRHIYYIINIF